MAEIVLKKDTISSNYMKKDRYNLVIIGAGNSGLSTGLLWQKNRPDDSVLIVEKEARPGGFITAYRKGDYVFETTQLFPDVVDIMDYLGVKIALKEFKGDFMRRLIVHNGEVKEYHLPSGAKPLATYLMEQFPGDADKIRKFMTYSEDLFSQVRKLKSNMTLKDKLATPFKAPKVMANLSKTYAQMLDKYGITNPDLRELMETFTSFAGVPPGRASSILTTGAMLSSISRCFRPYGYFDEFPAVEAELFQQRGGELLLNSEVEHIAVENGTARGIKLKGTDDVIPADRVVSTVDPMVAMRRLVGDKHLPAEYVEKLKGIIMSSSSFNIALGLDDRIDMSALDLDYPYNVLSTELGTTDCLFDAFLRGENGFSKTCFHLGVICPSLTTGGKNTLTLRAVPFGPGEWIALRSEDPVKYREEKEKLGDFFIGLVEKHMIPGLKEHIVVKDIATPATYARYSGSPTGSIYDMASIVTQFGPKRLPMKTPVANLFMPKFSHGIYGTTMGAVQVVDLMLNRSFNNGDSLFNPRR